MPRLHQRESVENGKLAVKDSAPGMLRKQGYRCIILENPQKNTGELKMLRRPNKAQQKVQSGVILFFFNLVVGARCVADRERGSY